MWRMAGVHCGESGVYVAYFSVVSSCQPRSKNNGTTYQKRNGATRTMRSRQPLLHFPSPTQRPDHPTPRYREELIEVPKRRSSSSPCLHLHTAAFEMHHEGVEQIWKVQQTSRSFDPHSREVPHVQTSICASRSINIPKPWVSALRL
jgi:hypothetical protein